MGRMLDHAGRACQRARLHAGLRQIDIATAAGVTHATISRFETGRRIPRDLELVIDAYAAECGLQPLDLWRAALGDWEAENHN